MNDYEMTSLANDRTRQLTAEAHQHRLGRQVRRSGAARLSVQPRRRLHISLDFLLSKMSA